MWMSGRKSVAAEEARTALREQELDEHASWGVGGPGFLPAALLDEFSSMLDELPAMLEIGDEASPPQQA